MAKTRTSSKPAAAARKVARPTRQVTASKARAARPARKAKHVYFFGGGKADGDRTMKDLLGGKGSGLAEMTNAGLPVPPGFTITTAACNLYYELGRKVPAVVESQMEENLRRLEALAGQQFGSTT